MAMTFASREATLSCPTEAARPVSPPQRRSSDDRSPSSSTESTHIQKSICTFADLALESRYIKSTAKTFRDLRVVATALVTAGLVGANVFCIGIEGNLANDLWANTPLNLSLCLLVIGLHALEPRKSTSRMFQLQLLATGVILLVTAAVAFTAYTTLRGGTTLLHLQRAGELHTAGLLFVAPILLLAETIPLTHTALVGVTWGMGWVLAVWGTPWALRLAMWTVVEVLVIMLCKWHLELVRRCRWLRVLKLENEIRKASGRRRAEASYDTDEGLASPAMHTLNGYGLASSFDLGVM